MTNSFPKISPKLWLIVLMLVAIILAGHFGRPASSSPNPTKYTVLALVGDKELKVKKGDVITQGKKDGENCVFKEKVGVRVLVHEGDSGPRVVWGTDEECRLIVTDIIEAGSS